MLLKKNKKAEQETLFQQQLRKRKEQSSEKKQVNQAIQETNENIKEFNRKRKELGEKITFAPMDELIPIKKAVNKGKDGFELINNFGFFDIVKIVSFDYSAMDDDDLSMHVFYWDRYYRTTANSFKRLSLNMPVDTTPQIQNYKKRLRRAPKPLYQEKIKKNIEELKTKFEDRQTRDYYLIYYAETKDKLLNERAHIMASLEERGFVICISPIRKLEVLNKLSNPYSNKTMLTENFTEN